MANLVDQMITVNFNAIGAVETMEKFESSRNLKGDFELDGYSSYDAMTNFVDGTYLFLL